MTEGGGGDMWVTFILPIAAGRACAVCNESPLIGLSLLTVKYLNRTALTPKNKKEGTYAS